MSVGVLRNYFQITEIINILHYQLIDFIIAGLARGDFAVAYPGHTATGSFSQTGDLIKFSGDAEFNYDTQKYSAKVDFNRQADPITISAEVNTPLKYKKIALDINHRGPLMK